MKASPVSQISQKIAFLGIMIVMAFGWMVPSRANAQFDGETWAVPINLSKSGLTTNPVIVTDKSGTNHVFWLDLLDGVVYTKNTGEQWDVPVSVDPPFEINLSAEGGSKGGNSQGKGSTAATSAQDLFSEASYSMYVPFLVADQAGKIHAFWLNDENKLLYSNISTDNMATADWSAAIQLAETVQDFDVSIDSLGRLHLVYVLAYNTTQYSSGIFYRIRNASSGGWSTPKSLFETPYFRAISPDEANIDIAVVEGDVSQQIYVAWDNRSRDTLNFIKSGDGGSTWDAIQEVQGPETSLTAITPYDIQVVGNAQDTILLWKEAESEVNCRQYYQVSKDGGESWNSPQRLLENYPGCPETNNLMIGDGGLVLLEEIRLDQVYLLAWDGVEWSSPQPQQAISNFIDPQTFQPIDLQCKNTILEEGNRLVMVGCDTNSGDIWFTNRSLESVSQWFPKPSNWSAPITVATGSANLSSLKMISDQRGRLHVVWDQRASDLSTTGEENSINYARWENDQWIVSPDVLVAPTGNVQDVDMAIDSKGRLFVVWSGGESGEIYYSWANAEAANSISEWAAPIALPTLPHTGSAPKILIDETDTIYVVFSISFNEDRGIYLLKSTDSGNTWSNPIRIFNGVAAGWEMVGHPHISQTINGPLHVIWTRNTLPGGSGSTALFYSHSDDQGETWAEPEMVVEAPIIWSQIQAIDDNSVYRIWQEVKNTLTMIWLEISTDNGITWSQPTNISGLGVQKGSAALIKGDVGQLHMLYLSEETTQNLILREWIWDGVNLSVGETLDLGSGRLGDGAVIAAGVTSAGKMGVMISKIVGDPQNESISEELISTVRHLELSEGVPTNLPQSTLEVQATLEKNPAIEPTPTPAYTPTPTLSPTTRVVQTNNQSNGSSGIAGMNLGTFLGVMAAGILIVLIAFVGIRSRPRN